MILYDDATAEKKSSNVLLIEYDKDTLILDVHFKGNRSYRYFDVPQSEVDKMTEMSSVGGWVYSCVRDNYKMEELP